MTDKSGHWLLTHRGAQFLHGELRVPAEVRVFRNRVEGYSEDYVSVKDVIGEVYLDKKDDYVYEKSYLQLAFI